MDLKGRQDLKDQLELLEQQGRKDLREIPDRQGRPGLLAQLVPLVLRARQDLKGPPDQQVLLDRWDRQDRLAQQARRVQPDRQALLVQLDFRGLRVPPAFKVHRGLRDRRAHKDLKGLQDRIGYKSRLCIGIRQVKPEVQSELAQVLMV